MAEFWDIDQGIEDPEDFFELVGDIFPEATQFFAEGSSVAEDVQACYERFADSGPYLPKRQTLWPRGKLFRCSATEELFRELAHLGARHAAPELLDHMSLYAGDRVLLEWHDAFANTLLLDGPLPESRVPRLAQPFGLKYGRARLGGV